jgi:hypothetical protein
MLELLSHLKNFKIGRFINEADGMLYICIKVPADVSLVIGNVLNNVPFIKSPKQPKPPKKEEPETNGE